MSSSNANLVRWGILGCGDVTEVKSGPALQKVDRSRLDCVMRRDGAKAADYAKRHNVPRWTDDAEALIADPELDAIYIATPPSTHADYAVKALRAGKNVLLEKPMALTPDECDLITQAVKETGQKFCVAFYRRALPRFEALREIANDGTIGDLRMIEVRHFKHRDEVPGQSWKANPSIGGGGVFVDMQSHTLDWLTYVFGRPVALSGLKKHQAEGAAAEDMVSYMMDFGGFAAVGLCAYATAEQEEVVILHGSKGKASMGFFRPSAILIEGDEGSREIALPDPAHVHQPFVERVIGHFLDDGLNPCSPEDGRRSTDLVKEIFSGL